MSEKNIIEVYTNCYAEHGLSAAIDGAAAAGLKHLEVAMKTHGGELVVVEDGILSERARAEDIRRLEERLAEKGLVISSANGGADMREREGVDLVKRRMAVAAQVGAKHFVIAGMHYNREETIRNHFREVADCAREHGMIVALETHPTLMHNADEILKTIDFFAHDAIRVNFDTANIYYHNESCIDMLKELERVKHLVGHVHLKDCRLQYHDWFFPALGKGKIDFPRTFEVLNGAGFFGPFSIEIEGIAGEKPNLETRQSWVRESVEYLTEIGVLQG